MWLYKEQVNTCTIASTITHSQSLSTNFQSPSSDFWAVWLPCQQLGGMTTIVDMWRAGKQFIGSVWKQSLWQNLNTSIHRTAQRNMSYVVIDVHVVFLLGLWVQYPNSKKHAIYWSDINQPVHTVLILMERMIQFNVHCKKLAFHRFS